MDQNQVPLDQNQVPLDQNQVPLDQIQVPLDQIQVPLDQNQVPLGKNQVPLDQNQVPLVQPQDVDLELGSRYVEAGMGAITTTTNDRPAAVWLSLINRTDHARNIAKLMIQIKEVATDKVLHELTATELNSILRG